MGLTKNQDYPNSKEQEAREWTVRKLFPFSGAAANLSKTFINPFDVLLGFLTLVLGVVTVLGKPVDSMMWVFAILLLMSATIERLKPTEPKVESKEKPKK